jgi:hypothetical protein
VSRARRRNRIEDAAITSDELLSDLLDARLPGCYFLLQSADSARDGADPMATPTAPVHTISTPLPQTLAPPGSWINATDPLTVQICLSLLAQSTSASAIDSNPKLGDFLTNISFNRTAVWLWINPSAIQAMTVVFHGADGPTPRFCVCAGKNAAVGDQLAHDLWKGAVKQFAVNNGNITTDNFYLWAILNQEPNANDAIFGAFNLISGDAGAPSHETYPNQTRWPIDQTTRRFTVF